MASTPAVIPPGFLWLILGLGGAIVLDQVTGLKCPICNSCFKKYNGTNGRIDWSQVPLKECPANYTHCLFSLDSWHPNGSEGQPSDVWAACSKQDMILSDCLNELENGHIGCYEGAVDKHGEKKVQEMLSCAGDLWGEGGVAPVTSGESSPAAGTLRTVCVCGEDGCVGRDGKEHRFRPLKCPFCENCYRKYPNRTSGKIDWGKVPLKACPPDHNYCSFWIPNWVKEDPAKEGEPAFATCSKSRVPLKECQKGVGVPLKKDERYCFDIHLQVVGHAKFDKAQDCLGQPYWPLDPGPAAKLEGPLGRLGAEQEKRAAIKSLCQCQEDNCTAKIAGRYTIWRPQPKPTPGPGPREKTSTRAPSPTIFPENWYPKNYTRGILVPFPYKSSAIRIEIMNPVRISACLSLAYLLLPASYKLALN